MFKCDFLSNVFFSFFSQLSFSFYQQSLFLIPRSLSLNQEDVMVDSVLIFVPRNLSYCSPVYSYRSMLGICQLADTFMMHSKIYARLSQFNIKSYYLYIISLVI